MATPEAVTALLAEARTDEEMLGRIQARFTAHCDASMTALAPAQFCDAMTELGAKREYCTQYFKAFDSNGDGQIDHNEFLLGSIAMDNNTYHGGTWGERRARYIFRTYDLNSDGFLDQGELGHLVRHLRRGKGESETPADVDQQAAVIATELGVEGKLSMEAWLGAVGSKKIRGTSKLFRLQTGYQVGGATNRSGVMEPGTTTDTSAQLDASWDTSAVGDLSHAAEPSPEPEEPEDSDNLQVHLAHTAIKVQGATEQATVVAMRVLEILLLDEKWMRTESFSPQVVSTGAIFQLTDRVIELLQKEESVVDLRAPCKVFGDIHGQFTDLKKFFATYGSPNHRTGDITLCHYVFIGDFIDRGACSLETICVLMSLKVRYPSRITLIRGNHEDRNINMQYGFRDECIERCGEEGAEVWERVNNVFDWLPLAACIEEQILCLHGGIGEHLESVDEIRRIQRPLVLGGGHTEMTPTLWDILWSDPTEDDTVTGIHANLQRGAGGNICKYGPDRVKDFCTRNDLKLIIRAHECVQDGYQYFASCHLITVFSATNYCARYDNDGAFLEISIDGNKLNVVPKVIKAKKQPESAQGHWRRRQFRPPSPVRGSSKESAAERDS